MERTNKNWRTSPAAIWASLGAAGIFEAATVLATQDKTARVASPWQDDPYDAVVSLTQFAVPMLALAITVRLLAWRAPGGQERMRQTVRAAAAMTALIGLTLAFEWAALISGAHAAAWGAWPGVLAGGLVVASMLTAVIAVLLVRRRRTGGSPVRRPHDWLGDVVFCCERVPVLRRWATPDAAAWVRRRAMTVFVALSVLTATGITAAQSIGERWTNPSLIAWMLTVETTSILAFCVIGNAVAGFIARPPRPRRRHVAEVSVVAGCVASYLAVAFRGLLRPAIGVAALTSVPALAAITLGAGLGTFMITAGLLLGRARRPIQ